MAGSSTQNTTPGTSSSSVLTSLCLPSSKLKALSTRSFLLPVMSVPQTSDYFQQNNGYPPQPGVPAYGIPSQAPPPPTGQGYPVQSPDTGVHAPGSEPVSGSPVVTADTTAHKSRRQYAAEQYTFGTIPATVDPVATQTAPAAYGQPAYPGANTMYTPAGAPAVSPAAPGMQPQYGGFQPIGAQADAGLSQQFSQMSVGAAAAPAQNLKAPQMLMD
ncbi:uncharacterized protein V1513DRAFT_42473 [Lipomyces chichibuensis]|uniref:uncharacterized protein n=1 Tax=Lipomyces chichibuensis TaxID=1546026 RepID=UPI003343AA27